MNHKARVLIVDDHQEMVELLRDQLTDAGYLVDVALSGEDALAKVRAHPPDAVISDLRMEKVDGFDVLDGVRALDETIPVFIMTAFGAIESAIEAIKRGAYHYLTKPFRLAEVTLYLERALAERKLNEELPQLARHLLEALKQRGPHFKAEARETIDWLTHLSWSGGAHELDGILKQLLLLTAMPTLEDSSEGDGEPLAVRLKQRLASLRKLEWEEAALLSVARG